MSIRLCINVVGRAESGECRSPFYDSRQFNALNARTHFISLFYLLSFVGHIHSPRWFASVLKVSIVADCLFIYFIWFFFVSRIAVCHSPPNGRNIMCTSALQTSERTKWKEKKELKKPKNLLRMTNKRNGNSKHMLNNCKLCISITLCLPRSPSHPIRCLCSTSSYHISFLLLYDTIRLCII